MDINDQEVFRDALNSDDSVLTHTAERFYHYVLRGDDVIYDTQALNRPPYAVVSGQTFLAFLLDNEIHVEASRALISGIQINRVHADAFGIQKIVTWLGEQEAVEYFPELTHR